MKMKAKLFVALSACALVGGATAGLLSSKDAVSTKATASSTTLYINAFDGGGNWANFSYYLFDSSNTSIENAEFPGESFTDSMKTKTPNEYDQYQYVLEIPNTYDTLILVGNPANWDGQAQTVDLKISEMSNNGIYCGSQIPDTNKFNVGYYGYSTKTVYMLDLNGDVYSDKHYCHTYASGKNGTTWPGVEMEKVEGSNNLYSAEINSGLDNVIFNNYGSNQTSAISLGGNEDAYIVYPDNGYNLSTLDAVKFIDMYMKFETRWFDVKGTGECKNNGWYASAKAAFESKTDAERTQILLHEPTKARLEAWAVANEESFDTELGVFSASHITLSTNKSGNDNFMPIVFIVSMSLVVLGIGVFTYLKRKSI